MQFQVYAMARNFRCWSICFVEQGWRSSAASTRVPGKRPAAQRAVLNNAGEQDVYTSFHALYNR